MPETVLAELSVEDRTALWQAILSQPEENGGSAVFVAERDGRLVAFASGGNQRASVLRDRGITAEISAIYVLQTAQRSGVGSALMAALVRALLNRGHRSAGLWVMRDNAPARAFYDRLGGEVVSEREDRGDAMTVVEVAYCWRDLHARVLHEAKLLQAE